MASNILLDPIQGPIAARSREAARSDDPTTERSIDVWEPDEERWKRGLDAWKRSTTIEGAPPGTTIEAIAEDIRTLRKERIGMDEIVGWDDLRTVAQALNDSGSDDPFPHPGTTVAELAERLRNTGTMESGLRVMRPPRPGPDTLRLVPDPEHPGQIRLDPTQHPKNREQCTEVAICGSDGIIRVKFRESWGHFPLEDRRSGQERADDACKGANLLLTLAGPIGASTFERARRIEGAHELATSTLGKRPDEKARAGRPPNEVERRIAATLKKWWKRPTCTAPSIALLAASTLGKRLDEKAHAGRSPNEVERRIAAALKSSHYQWAAGQLALIPPTHTQIPPQSTIRNEMAMLAIEREREVRPPSTIARTHARTTMGPDRSIAISPGAALARLQLACEIPGADTLGARIDWNATGTAKPAGWARSAPEPTSHETLETIANALTGAGGTERSPLREAILETCGRPIQAHGERAARAMATLARMGHADTEVKKTIEQGLELARDPSANHLGESAWCWRMAREQLLRTIPSNMDNRRHETTQEAIRALDAAERTCRREQREGTERYRTYRTKTSDGNTPSSSQGPSR